MFSSFFTFFGFFTSFGSGAGSAFRFELFLVVWPLLELQVLFELLSLFLPKSMTTGLLVAFGAVFLCPELDSLSWSGSLTTSLFFFHHEFEF